MKILYKLNLLKATESRAKVIHKKEYGEKAEFIGALHVNTFYRVTFAYMIDNSWTEADFEVSKKIYNSFSVGDEGILKHNYTEFIDFKKFINK